MKEICPSCGREISVRHVRFIRPPDTLTSDGIEMPVNGFIYRPHVIKAKGPRCKQSGLEALSPLEEYLERRRKRRHIS